MEDNFKYISYGKLNSSLTIWLKFKTKNDKKEK